MIRMNSGVRLCPPDLSVLAKDSPSEPYTWHPQRNKAEANSSEVIVGRKSFGISQAAGYTFVSAGFDSNNKRLSDFMMYNYDAQEWKVFVQKRIKDMSFDDEAQQSARTGKYSNSKSSTHRKNLGSFGSALATPSTKLDVESGENATFKKVNRAECQGSVAEE